MMGKINCTQVAWPLENLHSFGIQKQSIFSLYFDIVAQELASIRICAPHVPIASCPHRMGHASPMMRKINCTQVA